MCVNCKENHGSRSKDCRKFKLERDALVKSQAEHISVGHARKLLGSKKYSEALKSTSNQKGSDLGKPSNNVPDKPPMDLGKSSQA